MLCFCKNKNKWNILALQYIWGKLNYYSLNSKGYNTLLFSSFYTGHKQTIYHTANTSQTKIVWKNIWCLWCGYWRVMGCVVPVHQSLCCWCTGKWEWRREWGWGKAYTATPSWHTGFINFQIKSERGEDTLVENDDGLLRHVVSLVMYYLEIMGWIMLPFYFSQGKRLQKGRAIIW